MVNKLLVLNKTGKEIFTTQDLAVIWQESNRRKLLEIIKYYVKTKQIYTIARGIYSTKDIKSSDLEKDITLSFEISQKISPNSYISLFTALKYHGLIFQHYEEIYSIASKNNKREIFNKQFIFKTMKDGIFRNDEGIPSEKGYRIAGIERALCDTLYLFPSMSIDNIDAVDIKKVREISKIYNNKSLIKRLNSLLK
jgi:predicted transcriptional regulator of viral defense system